MKNIGKTVHQWLLHLPVDIRAKFINNWNPDWSFSSFDQVFMHLENVISDGFEWESSPEGENFWTNVYSLVADGAYDQPILEPQFEIL